MAKFVEALPAGSRVAVIAFSDDVVTICPLTTNFGRVVHAVNAMRRMGRPLLMPWPGRSTSWPRSRAGRGAGLTDGEDNQSQSADLESVSAEARRLGLPIHTLGLGSEDQIASDALKEAGECLARAVLSRPRGRPVAEDLRGAGPTAAVELQPDLPDHEPGPDGTLRPVSLSYRASKKGGATAVFIPGMVVPAGGWSGLFLLLLAALSGLAFLPGWLGRHRSSAASGGRQPPVPGLSPTGKTGG